MPSIKFKIQNYRNIPLGNPLEFEIQEGITFILGLNNTGKSNLLKFFREFKSVLSHLVNGILPHSNKGGYVMRATQTFDTIVNRKNLKKPVLIEISHELVCLKIEILSRSRDTHDVDYKVDFEFINPHNPKEILISEIRKILDFLYIGAFRSGSGNIKSSGSLHDIQIGNEFVNIWSQWSGGKRIQDRVHVNLLISELKEIFGFSKFDIRVNDEKSDLLVTTDDGDFLLTELGDGIGNFIVVLGNAAIKEPGYIFIDEPEISLHPKMQEVFVRTLASKAKYGLIASSHSVGLARSVADNLLSLTRRTEGKFYLTPFGQNYEATIAQAINEMSYSQFVEIGGNNILLVEGRTDIKAYREILRKFGIENKFILISLGGSEFICGDKVKIYDELNELKRLNPKSISVIFDSERTSPKEPLKDKFQLFEGCCEELGFNVFATDYHSTENYLTQGAIDKVLDPSYEALTPYQHFDIATKKWNKEKNWLMFREMNQADLTGTELSEFIEKILKPLAT